MDFPNRRYREQEANTNAVNHTVNREMYNLLTICRVRFQALTLPEK